MCYYSPLIDTFGFTRYHSQNNELVSDSPARKLLLPLPRPGWDWVGTPLRSQQDTIKETVDDFNVTLLEQAERLLNFEESLKARFTNLEIVLGRLNAQKDTFNSALAGIQNIFSAKK